MNNTTPGLSLDMMQRKQGIAERQASAREAGEVKSDTRPSLAQLAYMRGQQDRMNQLQQANEPAPTPENNQGYFGDMVDSVQMGALQAAGGITETAHQLTGSEFMRNTSAALHNQAKDQIDQMSAAGQEAMQKEFFYQDEDGKTRFGDGWTSPRAFSMQVGNLLGQLGVQIPGGYGTGAIGRKLTGGILERAGARAALNRGANIEDAAAYGKNFARTATGTGGQALFGAGVAGGMIGNEIRDEWLAQPDDIKNESPAFQEVYHFEVSRNHPELSVDEKWKMADQIMAERLATAVQSDPKLIMTNLALDAVGGYYFDRILRGVGTGSRLQNAAQQAGAQGLTEMGQGGMERYVTNTTFIDERADPNRDPMDNVLVSALNEGVIGGGSGALLGAATKGKREFLEMPQATHTEDGRPLEPLQQNPDLEPLPTTGFNDGQQTPQATLEQVVEQIRAERGEYRGIDDDIHIAEQQGFTDEAVRLRAAKRNFEMAVDFANEGDTESAQRFRERGMKTYRDIMDSADPEQRDKFPVEYVASGEYIARAEQIPMPIVTMERQSEVFDQTAALTDESANFYAGYDDSSRQEARQKTEQAFTQQYGEAQFSERDTTPQGDLNKALNNLTEALARVQRKDVQDVNIKGIKGRKGRIKIGDAYQPLTFKLVDLADNPTLQGTMTKAENQNRDRTRLASEVQINQIARELDFNEASESPRMSGGAPTITREGMTVGGNGRLAAIRKAYQDGTADSYREEMKARAGEYGLTASQIEKMKMPALIRQLDNSVDVALAAVQSQDTGTMALSQLEQASSDGRLFPNVPSIEFDDKGNIMWNADDTRAAVRGFVQSLPSSERAGMVDGKGQLSPAGKARFQNLLFYKAYGDSSVLSSLIESTGEESQNIKSALMALAPKVANVRQGIARNEYHDVDVTDHLIEAVELLESLRQSGRTMSDYLSQIDMISATDDVTNEIATQVENNIRSSAKLRTLIETYYDNIIAAGDPSQGSMFGPVDVSLRSIVGLSDDNRQTNAEQTRPNTQQPQAIEGGESGRDNRREQGTQAKADESTRPEQDLLSDYTEQDLASAEQERTRKAKEESEENREAEQKAQADAEANDFVLSGSNRPADVATSRGQGDLLSPDPRANQEPQQTPADAGVSLFSASDFVESPNGGINYGEITADMAKAAGRQGGKIRLERGNEKYGLIHIDLRHGKQIKELGYTDIKDFILDAVKSPDFVWRPSKTSQLVIIDNIGKGKAVFVEMKAARDESGDYYTVNTAFPVTSPDYENRKKDWKLLWSRETGPATPAAEDASLAEPDQSKDGDRATMSLSQSRNNSVADVDGDSQAIRNAAGKPFKNIGAARIALKKNPGYEIAKVEGGYELQPTPEGAAASNSSNMAEPPRIDPTGFNDDLMGDIDAAANEAATSPLNDKPEPTEAQIEAGNYEKGHVSIQGLDITIENPRDSKRSGTDSDGKPWSVTMKHHYGYIKRSEGADGENVDVFIGKNPESEKVFVVDQVNPDGTFDEHKVMIGFTDKAKAIEGYRSSYTKGWKVGPVTQMTMADFKAWLDSDGTAQPLSPSLKSEVATEQAEASAPKGSELNWSKDAGRKVWRSNDGQIITDESFGIGGQTTRFFPIYASQKERDAGNNYASGISVADAKSKAVKQDDTANQQDAEQPAPIEDAGEKLGGARKDELKGIRERLESMDDRQIASSTLSQLWPKGEVDKIENTMSAALYHAIRSEIPNKPRKGYKLQRWVESIKNARELIGMVENEQSASKFMEMLRAKSPQLSAFADKVELLTLTDRKDWPRIESASKGSGEYNDGTGKLIPGSWLEVKIDGRRHNFYGKPTPKEAAPEVKKILSVENEAPKMKFEIRGSRDNYRINKTGDREYRALKSFTNLADARKYKNEHHDELVAAWEAVKQRDNITKADMRPKSGEPRTGVDYRNGKDVTPEQFLEAFGFRGVEFGNWVSQGKAGQERQGMLNDAFDAFMDLGAALNLPPKALSLEGKLGIGFGSRGRGGKAMAHFEADTTIINLTKTKGAGSLAHEWFHALDNYFARKRGTAEFKGDQMAYDKASFVTYKPEPRMVHKQSLGTRYEHSISMAEFNRRKENTKGWEADDWVIDPNHPNGIRPEVEKAFAELVETLNASPMAKRASVIDKGKVDGYWSQIIERAARSFETHIIAKLADQGQRNDFLASVAAFERFEKNPERYPYLTPSEQGPVSEAFDKLFDTLEASENPDGSMAINEESGLYSGYERENTNIQSRSRTGRSVSEPEANRQPKQIDLFTPPETSKREALADIYGTTVKAVKVGEVGVNTAFADTPEQLAEVLRAIADDAQENFFAVVTGSDGRILRVIHHTRGLIASASVDPTAIVAEAASIEGAAVVHYGHNHPSGNTIPSDADTKITNALNALLEGTGIEPGYHVIVSGNEYRAIYSDLGRYTEKGKIRGEIPKNKGNVKVPITQKRLDKREKLSAPVTSPAEAIQSTAAHKNAVYLLDQQHYIVGIVPMTQAEMSLLREGGRVNRILAAINNSNAAAVIIRSTNKDSANNVASFINRYDSVRLLDAIIEDDTQRYSLVEKGGLSSSTVFFSKQKNPSNTITPTKEQTQKADQVRDWIKDVAKDTGVKVTVVESKRELPDDVKMEIGFDNMVNGFFEGVYSIRTGEAYLIAEMLHSKEDAIRTALHEALGHGAVLEFLNAKQDQGGKTVNDTLDYIFKQAGRKVVMKEIERYGLDPNNENQRRTATLEYIAHLAEKGKKMGLVRRFVAALRDFIRKIYPSLNWNDTDTLALIEKSRQHGKRASMKEGSDSALLRKTDQTKTPAFKKWFGDSRVVDAEGKPLVVYHGTNSEIETFSEDKRGSVFDDEASRSGFFFTEDFEDAEFFANKAVAKNKGDANVISSFVKIEKPFIVNDDVVSEFTEQWLDDLRDSDPSEWEFQTQTKAYQNGSGINKGLELAVADAARSRRYDGVIVDVDGGAKWFIPFKANQIKSATDNNGDFDGSNPNILFRLSDALENDTTLTDDQKAALSKIGPKTTAETAMDRVREALSGWRLKVRQGMTDRFAALLEMDKKLLAGDVTSEENITKSSWVRARMSNVASGAVSAMMNAGRIYMNNDRVIDVKEDTNGLIYALNRLGSAAETERFFGWIAGNRADKLRGEGRENLFDGRDIDALRDLNTGTMPDGRDRNATYESVFADFQKHRDDVLAIAEKAGIITAENRDMWANEFYVPFYRLDEEVDQATGPRIGGGLSRQEAYKKLKGGTQNLNDLLQNTILNFHHLIDASMKNIAAQQALDNAETLGVAERTAEAIKDKKQSTFVLRNGKKEFYNISDPLVFQALTSLSPQGMDGAAMNVLRWFKRTFTNLTTSTPQFIIANLIRDSLSSIAVTDMKYNPLGNVVKGTKDYGLFDRSGYQRARLMASGGGFSFGHVYGEDADSVRYQIDGMVRRGKVLRDPKAMLAHGLKPMQAAWDRWQDINNTFENSNRMAAFQQAESDGKGTLYAAFQARDLMDFSASGAWPAVRFLIDTVPFLNARIQGLDKLYRSGVKPSAKVAMQMLGVGSIETSVTEKQAAARFGAVVAALSAATMMLFMHNQDDEEYQKAEDWLKDTYWWVRMPGTDNVFFIPKPFEVGAIATLTERMLEQAVNEKATGKLFRERFAHMLTQTFAFSVIPQALQPAIDVYSNKDSFTGRQIETMGQQRLSPSNRVNPRTTLVAEKAGAALEGAFGADSSLAVSPVQIDYLIANYFGQVGAWAVGHVDVLKHALSDNPAPAKNWYEYQPIRRFYKNMGDPQSDKQMTLFYEALREAGRLHADVQHLRREGHVQQADEMQNKNRSLLNNKSSLDRVSRSITRINAQIKQVRANPSLSADEKRRRIDLLQLRKKSLIESASPIVEQTRQ